MKGNAAAQVAHFKLIESFKTVDEARIRLLGVRSFFELVYARRMAIDSDSTGVQQVIDTHLPLGSKATSDDSDNVRGCELAFLHFLCPGH